jgi:beta-glucanase (GH16 family)
MYKGSEVRTKDKYQFFNAECMMMPAEGSGIISSMFSFYDGADFKTNWDEIDFEFKGKNTNQVDLNLLRTVNYYIDRNVNVKQIVLPERSSARFWKLGIESTPSGITWKIDDKVVSTTTTPMISPQKIIFNIWASDDKNWAGETYPNYPTKQMQVSYFRLSKWNNGNFEFLYQDEFNGTTLDLTKWDYGTHKLDSTQLVKENVSISGGSLLLNLTKVQ